MAIERRYEAILQAACDVFARRGFHQASTREIARAVQLSIAGLYHYVGGKDELLFLALDHSLDRLIAALGAARARAAGPEAALLALIRTHLDFGLRHPHALKIINRDYELLAEPNRGAIAAKRQSYLEMGLAVLRELDPGGRSAGELLSATNLLLGMLNGIATRPFLRSHDDVRALAGEVAALFLYGFLGRAAEEYLPVPAAISGGEHDG